MIILVFEHLFVRQAKCINLIPIGRCFFVLLVFVFKLLDRQASPGLFALPLIDSSEVWRVGGVRRVLSDQLLLWVVLKLVVVLGRLMSVGWRGECIRARCRLNVGRVLREKLAMGDYAVAWVQEPVLGGDA